MGEGNMKTLWRQFAYKTIDKVGNIIDLMERPP